MKSKTHSLQLQCSLMCSLTQPRQFLNSSYSDVTLVCGEHEFPSHRAFLCSSSKYLLGVCKNNLKVRGVMMMAFVIVNLCALANMTPFVRLGGFGKFQKDSAGRSRPPFREKRIRISVQRQVHRNIRRHHAPNKGYTYFSCTHVCSGRFPRD